MYIYLSIFSIVLFILIYTLDYYVFKKIKKHLVGFVIYYILLSIILVIILDSKHGLESVNDYFTSVILIIGILISFIIFLTNRSIISSTWVVDYINKIPEHIPFSHALKSYLLSLIKVNNRVKVLLRTPDDKNYKWVLNQISAYNAILEEEEDKSFKESIEFIFIDNKEKSVESVFNDFKTDRYSYIVITSLSKLFKDAIDARELLNDKSRVKIIGALSSISDNKINDIINKDYNIVRVFPPDYDEANTAINFIFYRIINNICTNQKCNYYKSKSNVIILHNGTYGRALRDKCSKMFKSEKEGLKYFTNSLLSDDFLKNSINFHSFNFTSDGEFIIDEDSKESFEERIKSLSNQENYYYLTGYEPNISNMLEKLNSVLTKYNNSKSYFLFCGTTTMYSWRKTILKRIKELSCIENKEAYYLKLKFYDSGATENNQKSKCSLTFSYKNRQKDIKSIMNDCGISNIDVEEYCSLEQNYISIITQQSLLIAKEVIENPEKSLLNAKDRILKKSSQNVDILVNGDSINQYEIEKME